MSAEMNSRQRLRTKIGSALSGFHVQGLPDDGLRIRLCVLLEQGSEVFNAGQELTTIAEPKTPSTNIDSRIRIATVSSMWEVQPPL